ncbi:hypothetical protein TanjilG_02165 [Lupinus angustifolius]|uniref:Fucosyltransferase n=1 Tax=Lupinus angustifolius TaxID=3871 RepID=A0A1J7HGK6_LUPAN|nr:hypothetical protein TanjilG_02165 [Lupinus angustifolius]
MDKMGLSSNKLKTLFVVCCIVFPFALTATLKFKNSSITFFEGFSQNKVLGSETTQKNVTTRGSVQNTTHENSAGTTKNNNTVSEVLQREIQNDRDPIEERTTARDNTASEIGLINAPLTSSSNSSSSDSIHDDQEKLLDGLLASGFDEASCISRLQSHLYRKVSPHKPSRYLISKLRNYEELHRRCGPNTIAYNKSMAYIENSKNNNGDGTMCKYLVFSPANGLGNRIISMAATFLYAILTNRVLLVRFGEDMHGLFCEPFLNSTWTLPNNSPFWNQEHVETYDTILDKDKANNSKHDSPSALFLNHQFTKGNPEKFFHCDHIQDLLRNVPLLILQTDQYFVPSLFMIQSFNLEINKMFPQKDTVFYHLAHYLYHPSNEAWRQITTFYQTYLAKFDEIIGIQIRVFRPDITSNQAIIDLVLNCTIENKLLPKLVTQNSVSYIQNHTRKAILVTSLSPNYGENLRAMYQNKQSISGEVIEVYQPSHEEKQKFGDNMHNMKAWTEMYLLSLSDILVTSSLSTFGYVAQGFGGLKPWILVKPHKKKPNSAACKQDFSSEPCFHYPPMHECNGKFQKHFSSSFPYLWECKDSHSGVKLISRQRSVVRNSIFANKNMYKISKHMK